MYIKDSQPSELTEKLPTMYDLPSEDPEEPGLPDEFHWWQPHLLSDTCCPSTYPSDRYFSAADLNLYYDVHHPYRYKRPDWFVVVDVPRLYEERDLRLSYVMWQEQVSPLVIVEMLSPGTEDQDLGLATSAPNQPPTKWEVYERILKVPYYFIFSRYTNELKFFRLVKNRYREQVLNQPRVWIAELQLGLGVWFGTYKSCDRHWLRWYDADGNWIPTPEEREEQALEREEQALEREEQALEREEQALERADRLAQRLRELGINPDEL